MQENEPGAPMLFFFGSGDFCWVVSTKPIVRNGREYTQMLLDPIPVVRNRYEVDKRNLIFDNPRYPDGLIWKEFLSSSIYNNSNYPSMPVWTVPVNFEGKVCNASNPMIQQIKQVTEKMEIMMRENKRLNRELDAQTIRLLKLTTSLGQWKDTYSHIFSGDKSALDLFSKILELNKGGQSVMRRDQ